MNEAQHTCSQAIRLNLRTEAPSKSVWPRLEPKSLSLLQKVVVMRFILRSTSALQVLEVKRGFSVTCQRETQPQPSGRKWQRVQSYHSQVMGKDFNAASSDAMQNV